MAIDWGHGPKPDSEEEGEEVYWKPVTPLNIPPPSHPNCRCQLEFVIFDWWKGTIRLVDDTPDWAAAGYDWPSVGDEQTRTDDLEEKLELSYEVNKIDEAEIAKLKEEKAVAATVNTLELEKLLELRGELRQLRRDRWIWFAWGAGLSPWLAMLLKWLAG